MNNQNILLAKEKKATGNFHTLAVTFLFAALLSILSCAFISIAVFNGSSYLKERKRSRFYSYITI